MSINATKLKAYLKLAKYLEKTIKCQNYFLRRTQMFCTIGQSIVGLSLWILWTRFNIVQKDEGIRVLTDLSVCLAWYFARFWFILWEVFVALSYGKFSCIVSGHVITRVTFMQIIVWKHDTIFSNIGAASLSQRIKMFEIIKQSLYMHICSDTLNVIHNNRKLYNKDG